MSPVFRARRNFAASAAFFFLFLIVGLLTVDSPVEGQIFGRRRDRVDIAAIRAHVTFLAGDALNGRGAGTRDEWIAAEYCASQFQRWGLEPIEGDTGFIQTIETPTGRTWNAVARLEGSDRLAKNAPIVLSAHLDSLGTRGTDADTIFNGADDDASGVAAVLELARVLASGRRPKRTIVFALFGSEERGQYGSQHFIERLGTGLDSIVANIQFEMIGRPDDLLRPGEVWLTGYERSTLGPALADRGARLVADPHPEQDFFRRSDNIQFAYRGVVAHTVASYGLHREYHTVRDEIALIDFGHMTRAIQSLVEPIAWLAGSTFQPEWRAGLRPERGRR